MLNNLVYIFAFLPILSSLIILLLGRNKSVIQAICFSTLSLMLFIAAMIAIACFDLPQIGSDLSFDIISIPVEFRINLVLCGFLIFLIVIKVIQLVLFQKTAADRLSVTQLRLYFASHLISCFAIVGIVISNNIFNIFLFIEIYFISYFALSMTFQGRKINYQNSKQIIVNFASSTLLLIALVVLYFNFETLNLNSLMLKIEAKSSYSVGLMEVACSLIIIALIVKFIPFWVFFSKNIKDSISLSSELFLVLFINLNLLICLLVKMSYIVFAVDLITSIIVFSCLATITYSSIIVIFNKHFRPQITLFCLSLFCFSVLCLAIKSQSSIKALFFYILSYNICALTIFAFTSFVWMRYNVSTIEEISILKNSKRFFDRGVHKLFLIIVILSLPLPYSPIFYANFFLFDAILDNNHNQLYEFSNFFDPYIVIAILLFYMSSIMLFFKITSALVSDKVNDCNRQSKGGYLDNIISFYFMNLVVIIVLLYVTIGIGSFSVVISKILENIFNLL